MGSGWSVNGEGLEQVMGDKLWEGLEDESEARGQVNEGLEQIMGGARG